jgi:hypothetical protein
MPLKPFRRSRLRRIALIKSNRAMRPVSDKTAQHYLDLLRKKWETVPFARSYIESEVFPEVEFVRVFMNRNGNLFAVTRNLMIDRSDYYIRIFRVNEKTLSLSSVGDGDFQIRLDGVTIWSVSKNNLVATHATRNHSILRPRGMDIARPIIEEAIRFARERGKSIIRLNTRGEKRIAYYRRMGFVPVETNSEYTSMVLPI